MAKLLASSEHDGIIVLWDTATGKEIRQLLGHADQVTCLAFRRTARRWHRQVGIEESASGK